jgi:hypothetical protein
MNRDEIVIKESVPVSKVAGYHRVLFCACADCAGASVAYAEHIKQEATVWAEEDSTAGNWDAVDDDAEMMDKAEEKQLADQEILTAAGDQIAVIISDATAALISAKLIDEADYDAAVELIQDV